MAIIRLIITMAVSTYLLTACSDQYKIVDPGATSEEVELAMDRMQQNSRDQSLIIELREHPDSIVYFTRSGSNGLLPESVFSITRMNAFSPEFDASYSVHVFEKRLSEVSIAFIDSFTDSQALTRQFALMVELNFEEGVAPVTFTGTSGPGQYRFTDDSFEARFSGLNSEILIRTHDLNDEYTDTLGNNVQFKVYEIVGGQEFYIGQFSTLAGFSS